MQHKRQDAAVCAADAVRKEKGRVDANKVRRAKESTVKQGDKVLLQQQKQNKLLTPHERHPYTVINRKGRSVIIEKDGKKMMRHVSLVKRWVEPEQDTAEPNRVTGPAETVYDNGPQQDSRPQRARRLPTHLTHYVT